jgi:hypothetical protein
MPHVVFNTCIMFSGKMLYHLKGDERKTYEYKSAF